MGNKFVTQRRGGGIKLIFIKSLRILLETEDYKKINIRNIGLLGTFCQHLERIQHLI